MQPEKTHNYTFPEEDRLRGLERLESGKVACIILTGGHSSRLGKGVPKGVLPLTPDGKSLLEIHLSKIPEKVPLALLVSPFSQEPIKAHLAEKGLRSCEYVLQGTLPYLNAQGEQLAEEGADGTGGTLHLLASSGLLEKWRSQGIEFLMMIPVDNPLAEPCDPYQIGMHKSDVTLKCIRRREEERMGVLARDEGRLHIIEYTELPQAAWSERTESGLKWEISYTNLACFSLDWIERVVKDRPLESLPLHQTVRSGVVKRERFLFDLYPQAQVDVVLYPREKCYAPWKQEEGPQGRKAVLRALDRK